MSERFDIIDNFRDNGMKSTLKDHEGELPYSKIFSDLVNNNPKLAEHIQNVVKNMYNLLYNKLEDVFEESVYKKYKDNNLNKSRGYLENLERLVDKLRDEDKYFLLYTALYHDIGKTNIKSRHGVEGAEIIKDSGPDDRERFSKLGFNRSKIFFMSDLIRFHDYLAMVGTGEVSYLIFAEVLYPVSNISISNPKCADIFIDFLLLLNLADMAGSMGKLTDEDFTVLMHDYAKIKKVQKDITKDTTDELEYRNYNDIILKLQVLSENHTNERLRRLLRSGLKDFVIRNKEYKNWIENHEDASKVLPPLWFSRNYEWEFNDIIPVNSSLRGINVKSEFYTKFAYICKLDYFLSFIRPLFETIIQIEIDKPEKEDKEKGKEVRKEVRKSPHDLRRDLSMTLVKLINMLVEEYGDFTLKNTKIGLGFERFNGVQNQDKMLIRLTGVHGEFKEAEAFTKLRNIIVLWVIRP